VYKTTKKEQNMKQRTKTNFVFHASLGLALALTICSPINAQSAQPKQEKSMTGMSNQEPGMMERCREMKEQKQSMMEELKAQDAQLTGQVATMNSAPTDKKVELMAGIVTRMVEQRIARDDRKAKMEEKMMEHMMEHMQQAMQMNMDSPSQCPMMKGTMDDKSSGGRR
jgi:hypothetical protein